MFDEHKANDDEQLPGAKGVDLNSSLDVFHAIYKQVSFAGFFFLFFFFFFFFFKRK